MTILVVDDEKLIAQGVAHVIGQFGEEFGPVDIAFSGGEALEKMARRRYDLLITDVAMPGLSGLDLIREAKARSLCGDFCILSGYSEFEFARTALQLGVEDYLLKPIDKAKLRKMLEAFQCKHRRRSHSRRRDRENQLADCLFNRFDLDAGALGQAPVLVTVVEGLFGGQKKVSRQDFEDLCESGLASAAVHIRQLPAFALFSPPEQKQPLLRALASRFPAMPVGCAEGPAPTAAALRGLYQEALHAALTAHCFLEQNALDAADFPRPALLEDLPQALAERFHVRAGDDRLLLYKICWQSLDAAAPAARGGVTNSYVAKMMDLVDRRFAEDLTLSSVAKDIGLNPEYAGKLFRTEEGQGFSEYLNRYRIARILECMVHDPSLSFEQLAPCMGFPDQRNFYRVFKRLMQTTPGKYRDTMQRT